MLREKIENKRAGIITYGLTPPKQNCPHDKLQEIAERQKSRIQSIHIDGLILYDIQEESERIKDERPFPFLPTMSPDEYKKHYLGELDIPVIVYRCVGKYDENEFVNWLGSDSGQDKYAVFVGTASHKQAVKLRLSDAYQLKQRVNNNLVLGGVAIPERHMKQNDEHLRIIHKTEWGCQFFVSQAIYNVEASKSFLSDYYYYCENHHLEMVPILFTFAPCGSLKTLDFMKWLGISIPRWLENELINSEDILDKSILLAKGIFNELLDFAMEKRIPIGCNIESVSVRKAEIEASVQLVKDINEIFKGVKSTD